MNDVFPPVGPAGPPRSRVLSASSLSGWMAGAVMALALCAGTASPAAAAWSQAPDTTEVLPGVTEAQLDPGFWIRRLAHPDRVILDRAGIAAQNAAMHRLDGSLHDIEQLPATLEAEQVRAWIEQASPRPTR